MATVPVAEQLRRLGTFAEATDRELRRIAVAGRVVTVPQNWSVIWERTPADKAYVVLDGDLDVRRKGEVVARLGSGDVVGEVAIVENRLRNATVVAATRLEVLHFTKDAVEKLYADIPAFRAAVDRAVLAHA
jgi:CRP/FNR family transcriptional regulator, cyclic AMP receptor protein